MLWGGVEGGSFERNLPELLERFRLCQIVRWRPNDNICGGSSFLRVDWRELEHDNASGRSLSIGSNLYMVSGIQHLGDVPDGAWSRILEEVERFRELEMVLNGKVPADHFHIPNLPLACIPERTIVPESVLVPVLTTLLAREDPHHGVARRRADSTLLLTAELLV
ncbi:MAG TPA: hypothetical protein VF647_11865 [Longimicrobium sp.]